MECEYSFEKEFLGGRIVNLCKVMVERLSIQSKLLQDKYRNNWKALLDFIWKEKIHLSKKEIVFFYLILFLGFTKGTEIRKKINKVRNILNGV